MSIMFGSILSRLIRAILPQPQGASAKLDANPTSTMNDVDEQNSLTAGGATMVKSFVAPLRRSYRYSLLLASQISTQGRSLQFGK